jgi:uncharacterized protein
LLTEVAFFFLHQTHTLSEKVTINMTIFFTMLSLGLILGFAGGGGSGFVLALLISVFNIPIHTALGTSTTSMVFTVLSGTASHMREGNMVVKTGLIIGAFGAFGSYTGTLVTGLLPENLLIWISASLLFLSSFLIWVRTRIVKQETSDQKVKFFWMIAPAIGLITGFLSGCFGIGSTPLIQLGLLIFLNMTLQQAAATSMLILIPVSLFGAIGYYQAGFIDWSLLVQIVAGTMTGSYIGAKFTKRASVLILRTAMILLPVFGGLLLLW